MSLEAHYAEVRNDLRTGYGRGIKDKGIDLRRPPESDEIKALRGRINGLQSVIDDQNVAIVKLKREVSALIASIAGIKDILVDYGEKLDKDCEEIKTRYATVNKLLRMVSAGEGIEIPQLTGGRRNKHIVNARHIICYLASRYTTASLAVIGRSLGGRDHSTILYAASKVGKKRIPGSRLDEKLKAYENQLARLTAVAVPD